MTPAQRKRIVAELRRSAVEDRIPWLSVYFAAFEAAAEWLVVGQLTMDMRRDDLRTFYLLVAHALEDER